MLRRPVPHAPSSETRKKWRAQRIVAREFQYRYSILLSSFGICFALIVGGITLYLLNHNYNLLIQAQLLTAPQIVDHLARELKMANEILVICLIGFVIFFGMIGVKITQKIIVPIILIQEKIRGICRGDLFTANVSIRKSDEFQEFSENYNYMVEVLRSQTMQDIERLEKLKPDAHNRDAFLIWEYMLNEKKAQLTGGGTASPEPIVSVRRVS